MKRASPEKLAFARKMRKAPTRAEATLWEELRYFRYAGVKFRRQVPLCGYIVDFYSPSRKLVIEVDGSIHKGREREDARRQATIVRKVGVRFVRFTNAEVFKDLTGVLHRIGKACRFKVIRKRSLLAKKKISTNPQRQQQQSSIHKVASCCCDERGGKVEKRPIPIKTKALDVHRPRGKNVESVEKLGLRVCLSHSQPIWHDERNCPLCRLQEEFLR